MRLSRFFITRPIFAAVIAIVITIIGGIAYLGLPVSQYPDIVPPTVTVSATYPGASAETVAQTVAATGKDPLTPAGPSPVPSCCDEGGTCKTDATTWAPAGDALRNPRPRRYKSP